MFAIAQAKAANNPALGLEIALKDVTKGHFPHVMESELTEFVQMLADYRGARQNKLATKLLLLTFVRTKELRGGLWSEIDWEKAEWRIPAERMKMKLPHIVPLSKQVILILKELKLMNGQWNFIFPNPYTPVKPMSANGILSVLYRMGYKGRTCGHGFRHTASTLLNERGFNRDHVEIQLAHLQGKIRGTYNHAKYLSQRSVMMQWWADFLDGLAAGIVQEIPLPVGLHH